MEGKIIFEGITMEKFEAIVENILKKIESNQTIKEYLSYKEAAELLDIKETTIGERVRKGMYKKYLQKGSNKPYVKRSDIESNFI